MPAFGFGAATREQAGKVFVSQEHTALATAGSHSPGPAVYLLPASVGGKQPDGRRPDPPVWRFGRDERFRPGSAPGEPAPNHYTIPTLTGQPQKLSKNASEPLFTFGTATRDQAGNASVPKDQAKALFGTESPGPAAPYLATGDRQAIGKQVNSKFGTGQSYSIKSRSKLLKGVGNASPGPIYLVPESVGHQPESTRTRQATPAFGTSTRDGVARVYISKEHGKNIHGQDTPGPAADYHVRGSFGKQVSSKNTSRPSSAFSRADRFGQYKREAKANTVPGPGAYDD